MLDILLTTRFKKDLKLIRKRGYDLNKLEIIISSLANSLQLTDKARDHSLSGNLVNYRECHIDFDWLLIYYIEGNNLHLIRTGTHSDLFEKNTSA